MRIVPALILTFTICTLCACTSQVNRRSGKNVDNDEIRLVVLHYMVTNCNSGGQFVSFADVPDQMLGKLRARCGPPWQVLPIAQCEHTNKVRVQAEWPKKIRQPLIRAKATEREGIIIGVGEIRYHGRSAEVAGFGESSGAAWRDRYEVRLVGDAWSIASRENIMVADFSEEILDSDK